MKNADAVKFYADETGKFSSAQAGIKYKKLLAQNAQLRNMLVTILKLFGNKWPAIEVFPKKSNKTEVLPLRDDDADIIRRARKLLNVR